MKEMVGGCCVCSDDRGWPENPLVYCDGQGCTVAVHQACYGIVTVPSGPWFCRKCESQERAAKVKCELCPSKDGALKRTDTQGWAHVVCALYIPEVRFGNVSTMEPIILSMVPSERYNKICYICEGNGKESKSKIGACMNCNKSGCKNHFHVTCAQTMGLLCEEAGTYSDNVKYCGYCQHHHSKIKKSGHFKAVPAFKPLPAPGSSAESVQDKGNSQGNSSWNLHHNSSGVNGSKDKNRKKSGRKSSSGSQVSPKAGNSRDSFNSSVITETSDVDDSKKLFKSEASQFTNVLAGVGLVPGPKPIISERELSNASETIRNDFQDSNENSKQDRSKSPDIEKTSLLKKPEKNNDLSKVGDSAITNPALVNPDRNRTTKRKNSTRSISPSSVGGNDTESTLSNVSDGVHPASSESSTLVDQKPKLLTFSENSPVRETSTTSAHSVIVTSSGAHLSESVQKCSQDIVIPQRSVSPLTITGIQSAGCHSKLQIEHSQSSYGNTCSNIEKSQNGSVSAIKKPRRGRTPKLSASLAPDSPPSSPDSSAGGEQPTKRRKKVPRSSATVLPATNLTQPIASTYQADRRSENITEPTAAVSVTSDLMKREISHSDQPFSNRHVSSLQSETPVLQTLSVSVGLTTVTSSLASKNSNEQDMGKFSGSKEPSIHLPNGIIAPHMLGNQINPTSSVAQKMTDTLTAELEAHKTSYESPIGNSLTIGVPFPPRSSSPSNKTLPFPLNLEQLLERQWEQGSQFLMEQAQHFDIASLLSCLHTLQIENRKLEDHVASLTKRREHLLAVHARLSIPLTVHHSTSIPQGSTLSERSPGPPVSVAHSIHSSPHEKDRNSRTTSFVPPVENGIGPAEHLSSFPTTGFSSPHNVQRSASSAILQTDRVIPSPVIVSSRGSSVYYPIAPSTIAPSTVSPIPNASSFIAESRNMMLLTSSSSTSEVRQEMIRTTTPSQHQHHPQPYTFQMVPPTLSGAPHHTNPLIGGAVQAAVATSQQHSINARRDVADPRHTIGRPSSLERR